MKAAAWLENVYETMHRPVTHSGSHWEEDAILRALLPDDPVVYVDVGAAEPEECNNTWQFYQAGGHGLLIEPLPEWWGPLLRHRHRDELWPTGASDRQGKAPFQLGQNGSTLGDRGNINALGHTEIELMPFRDILNLFPDIRDNCQLCDVDVEGHEEHVFNGMDWDTFRPDVFCVEDYDGKWSHLLTEHGYVETARTVHNIIYTKDGYLST